MSKTLNFSSWILYLPRCHILSFGDIVHAIASSKKLVDKGTDYEEVRWCKENDDNIAILHFHRLFYIWFQSSFIAL